MKHKWEGKQYEEIVIFTFRSLFNIVSIAWEKQGTRITSESNMKSYRYYFPLTPRPAPRGSCVSAGNTRGAPPPAAPGVEFMEELQFEICP